MVLDAIDAHRFERPVADVMSDGRALDASLAYRIEERRVEVQSRSRCRDRSACACIHCLIALPIQVGVVALDVRRKRYVSEVFDRSVDVFRASDLEAHE